jgi:membrane-associated phospholipid phosphatase
MSKLPARRDAAPTEPPTLRRRPTATRHGPVAQLLIALSPLSLILLAYAVAQWVDAPLGARGAGAGSNRLGLPLHVAGPAGVDRDVFGAVPSVWLQQRLVDGSAHWYDAAAALVYVTHFVAIPLVTGVAWFWLRDRFRSWVAAVVAFTTVGVGGYVLYPAAPPWLASHRGEIGIVHRLSSPGWDYLHLDVVGRLIVSGQQGSNAVAAMPSLHAGSAMLVALFLWPVVRARWRAALVGYVLLMALTLVYTGEHYVVDVVAGWLTAGVAVVVGWGFRRRVPTRRPEVHRSAAEP